MIKTQLPILGRLKPFGERGIHVPVVEAHELSECISVL